MKKRKAYERAMTVSIYEKSVIPYIKKRFKKSKGE